MWRGAGSKVTWGLVLLSQAGFWSLLAVPRFLLLGCEPSRTQRAYSQYIVGLFLNCIFVQYYRISVPYQNLIVLPWASSTTTFFWLTLGDYVQIGWESMPAYHSFMLKQQDQAILQRRGETRASYWYQLPFRRLDRVQNKKFGLR